ncbi:MAG: mechanosensitive ion channel [Alphaproteobacteria bacterium]|nr:mechanosensitive ion channel [Alphaproteobacteria bacterium]
MNVSEKLEIEVSSLEAIFSSLGEKAVAFGLKLIAAVAILIFGIWLSNRLMRSLRKLMERKKFDASLSSFLLSFLNIAFKVFVVVICLTTVGVQMTSIVAVLGAASLAIGMALSGTLQNFAGGIVLLVFKPFKVGDAIETQSGKSGTVKKIMIFTTELHTFDNKVIFLPNGALANGEITNLSQAKNRRSDIKITVSYGDDIALVRRVVLGILDKDTRVLKNPEPLVFINSLAEKGVEIIVRYWADYGDVYDTNIELIEEIYKALPKKKISFSFPQMDVRLVK